ncbi:TIGR04141 family sporadically distributed protein [Streptococcus koreensis]|uniref:DUF6119 family protein n=1 Tax=Streptococcus koreensis TaxID=2382163 RepID=UPI003CEA718A
MGKNTENYNLLLHNTNDFKECLKEDFKESRFHELDVEKHNNFKEGRIYIASTEENTVEWLDTLNSYTKDSLEGDLYKNKSNKAVLMLKYEKNEEEKDYIFSLVYGYGRTMLDDRYIVKNFGLRTAINLIEERNIKSLNSLNISRDFIDIQRQALSYVSHSDLQVNTNADILKSISGKAPSSSNFSSMSGADNLRFSAKSDVILSELLEDVLNAYKSDSYKQKGLEWIDHVQYVKEKEIISELDGVLLNHITNKSLENPIIAPNKIVSYLDIEGYFISGMNISHKIKENFYDDIPSDQFWEYLYEKIEDENIEDKIIDKLKSCSLYCWTNDSAHKISSIYDSLFIEIDHNNEKFFINNGDWFKIESAYYGYITNKIDNIAIFSDPMVPSCAENWNEGEFNEKFAASNPNRFKLFDKKNFHLPNYGHSKIEPADIITTEKQFIHVKKGGSSANLSHLFAQGVVSAQLYKNEKKFIKEINETFGEGYFKSDDKIEVIYGIIDKRYDKKASEILPFFSMINLSQHYDVLSSMGIKCQLLFIEQKVPVYNKKEEQILNRVLETLGDHEKTSSELFESLNDFLMENKIGTKNTFKNKYLEKFVNNGNLQTNDARRNRKYRKQVTT